MSLETSELPAASGPSRGTSRRAGRTDRTQWKSLCEQVSASVSKETARAVFGDSAKGGGVYRWGLAASRGSSCSATQELLSRLACGQRPGKKHRNIDLDAAAASIVDSLESARKLSIADACDAVLWAAALPTLTERLNQQVWWNLLGCLQQLRESYLQRGVSESPVDLLIGVELPLTLAWRLRILPSCKRLEKPAADALAQWCKYEEEAIAASVAGGIHVRLVAGSLIRCRSIMEKTTRRKWKKQQLLVADEIATWTAAMTTHTGQTALSSATRKQLSDDLPPAGLLGRAAEIDPEALQPAIAAALGETQSGGRLAWEVCLPEAFHHSEEAKIAVMFPDWDVRRGRMHIDYSGQEPHVELFAGRSLVVTGHCQAMIEIDGQRQQVCGDWDTTCHYTDDDVHYLEIEQPWTGGVLLQRQFMLVRDDRCVLMADSVLPRDEPPSEASRKIRYDLRLPLAPSISADGETETREMFLCDGRRRGLVIPLSASEWRVGPTDATLKATPDGHLQLTSTGTGSLYTPLWFDFQQRRFSRKRTWRQLTVADQLRIVRRDEAVGYRIQIGSEQWLVYRSFDDPRPRSVLGKHLVADFFSARFDMSDGSLEELVTVDDSETADD